MYFNAIPLLALALAGRSAARTLIGYRTVNSLEAAELNEHETFVHLNDAFFPDDLQLGKGKYISPYSGQWNVGTGNKYCIIWADDTKYNAASKVWIPKARWWPTSEDAMKNYINSLGVDARLSMRYSEIDGKPGELQAMIPIEMFDQYDHGIAIEVKCYDTLDQVRQVESATVDYNRPDIINRAISSYSPPAPAPCAPVDQVDL